MKLQALPFDSDPGAYEKQAEELLAAHRSSDRDAIRLFHQKHPRFLDTKIRWLPKDLPDSAIRDAALDLEDANLALARWYDFLDWPALAAYAGSVARRDSPVFAFESAVEAVIAGDLPALRAALRKDPDLVRARSARVTHFDPPVHRATLLHYVAANGVEGHRQKTPSNAVEIARILLEAGAEADALADMYGGSYTTMSMLVSSCHPANAGVQVALVDLLLDFGAAVEGSGSERWRSPLMTALAFGYMDAAEALVRRGARVDTIEAAAGLGRLADAERLLPDSGSLSRHRALALAAQHGHTNVVKLLLDAGEDPDRYNHEGNHAHSTPLHQAIAAGREDVVGLLVERGVRLDIKDTIYQGTPLSWAIYCRQPEIEKYLRGHGAKTSRELEP